MFYTCYKLSCVSRKWVRTRLTKCRHCPLSSTLLTWYPGHLLKISGGLYAISSTSNCTANTHYCWGGSFPHWNCSYCFHVTFFQVSWVCLELISVTQYTLCLAIHLIYDTGINISIIQEISEARCYHISCPTLYSSILYADHLCMRY